MKYLILSIQLLITIELLLFSIKNVLSKYLNYLAKILKVISSPSISEHFKDKVLPLYAIKNFLNTIILIFISLVSLFPFVTEYLIRKDLFTISKEGLIFSFVFGFFYLTIRSKLISKKEKYSYIEQSLHYLILENPLITDFIFSFEKILFSTQRNKKKPDVYICGLARSGTTMILNQLYKTKDFYSLTYKDMPFILSPKTWRIFNSLPFKKNTYQQRAHEDGLLTSASSPEAFEEVFWLKHTKKDYLKYNSLIPCHPSLENLKNFEKYINYIKTSKCERYLSKNNNNILRLHSLSSHFENDIFIIPFRNPIEQCHSLLKQHNQFNNNAQFEHDYFKMLGHYEFGSNHKPFRFSQIKNQYRPNELNYWLEIWLDTYTFLLKQKRNNIHFICYERLCNSLEEWNRLAQITSCQKLQRPEIIKKEDNLIDNNDASNELIKKCFELYENLNETI